MKPKYKQRTSQCVTKWSISAEMKEYIKPQIRPLKNGAITCKKVEIITET